MKNRISVTVIACLLLLTSGCSSTPKTDAPKTAKNLIVIVADTLAAKHLGTYNPALKNSPSIDLLAQNGVRFTKAYSTAPWTKPSIASLFTSQYPHTHNTTAHTSKLPEQTITASELLRERGFRTFGVVSNEFIDARSGFGQGFEMYESMLTDEDPHQAITSEAVTNATISWIDSTVVRSEEQPRFFAFVHYFDPHYNYQRHPQFDRTSWYHGRLSPGLPIRRLRQLIPILNSDDVKYLTDMHHEEIAFMDHHIGRLVQALRDRNLLDSTLIVFAADHGEEFMEHGYFGHSRSLYDELIHIPLIFSWTGFKAPTVIDTPASLVDVLPTAFNVLGLTAPPHGWSGVAHIETGGKVLPQDPQRPIFAEVDFKSSATKAKKRAVMVGDKKFIQDLLKNEERLYDRGTDPKEVNNIIEAHAEIRSALVAQLDVHHSGTTARAQPKLTTSATPEIDHSPEDVKRLESLGYM